MPGLGLCRSGGTGVAAVYRTGIGNGDQEHYQQTQMPFAELLPDIGRKQRGLSIAELADFVHTHLSAAAQAPKAEQVEVSPRRTA